MRELAVETDPAVKYSPNKRAVILFLGGSGFNADGVPIQWQFFRDHHGKARISAVAKLRVIHQDRGGVVGIDSNKGIGH